MTTLAETHFVQEMILLSGHKMGLDIGIKFSIIEVDIKMSDLIWLTL